MFLEKKKRKLVTLGIESGLFMKIVCLIVRKSIDMSFIEQHGVWSSIRRLSAVSTCILQTHVCWFKTLTLLR